MITGPNLEYIVAAYLLINSYIRAVARKMSQVLNQSETSTDDSSVANIIAAYMAVNSFIMNHGGSLTNNTGARDLKPHIISLVLSHMELVANGTEVEGILDSITRILSYISNHRELLINITHIEDARLSFQQIWSFWSTIASCTLYTTVTNAIIGTICGLGVLANIVAFNIFGKMGHRNSSTMLLRALAVMDSVLLLFAILNRPHQPDYYAFSAMYIRPVYFAAQIAAVWTSVLLGINRYIVVCRPFMASRWCTASMARKQLAFVIFVALVYTLPQFFEIQMASWNPTDGSDPDFSIVYRLWAENDYYQIIYKYTLCMIVLFIAPFISQLILSIRLGAALRAARKGRHEMCGIICDTDKNVTKLVLCVLVVFLVCYIPVAVNSVLWIVHGNNLARCGDILFYYQPISLIFIVLNSSVNCLNYVIFNLTFRKTLKTIFSRRMSTTTGCS